MPFYSYFYDYTYFLLVVPVLILSLIAQFRVKSTFNKYARMLARRNITAEQAAMRVLQQNNVTSVRFETVPGNLTDHYDPRSNIIRLSQSVANSSSVAAIGVACHEAGHAVQHAEHYAPIKIRNSLIPVCNFSSALAIPLALMGFWMGFEPLIWIGVFAYAAVALFQLVTLPVEFDASRRALRAIDEAGVLDEQEQAAAKRVLTAAAMTYVAALAMSLANLLRLLLRVNRRN